MGILIVGAALAFIGIALLIALGAASMLAELVLAVFRRNETGTDRASRRDAIDDRRDALSERLDENTHRRT